MHLEPVSLGLTFVTENIAVFPSSSLRPTWPADHELFGFAVVAENAACEAPKTVAHTASIATGVTPRPRTIDVFLFMLHHLDQHETSLRHPIGCGARQLSTCRGERSVTHPRGRTIDRGSRPRA